MTKMIIFSNWVTHISVKETVHTVKRKKYISLLLKNILKTSFEHYVICEKFGTLK